MQHWTTVYIVLQYSSIRASVCKNDLCADSRRMQMIQLCSAEKRGMPGGCDEGHELSLHFKNQACVAWQPAKTLMQQETKRKLLIMLTSPSTNSCLLRSHCCSVVLSWEESVWCAGMISVSQVCCRVCCLFLLVRPGSKHVHFSVSAQSLFSFSLSC